MQAHGQAFEHFYENNTKHYFMVDEIVVNYGYVH